MHTTRQEEHFATLRDGHDFLVVIRFMVMAMARFYLVHLDGLGNADADFRLPPGTSRATAGHIETVHVSGVHFFAQVSTGVKGHHEGIGIDATLWEGKEEMKVGVYAGGENDDIDDTEDGTDGAGFNCGSNQTFNDVVGFLKTGLASTEEVEERQCDSDIHENGN